MQKMFATGAVHLTYCAARKARSHSCPNYALKMGQIMKKILIFSGLIFAAFLAACASTSSASITDKITSLEAKQLACPESVLNAGASPEDCSCVENKLYEIGQEPGAIQYDNAAPHSEFGGEKGRREIAIGILRLGVFEYCGLFDPEHTVSKNLQKAR